MAECPSAAWERYYDQLEAAEEGEEMQRIDDLARALWGFYVGMIGATWGQIEKAVFQGTRTGVAIYHNPKIPGQVDVHGYCEGVGDQVCPSYILEWPYTHADIEDAVRQADQDAADLWDETHGCEACGPVDEHGDRHINPECPECKGEGIIR